MQRSKGDEPRRIRRGLDKAGKPLGFSLQADWPSNLLVFMSRAELMIKLPV